MNTEQVINSITSKIVMNEVTDREVDIAILQILSSMYNEKQRDRDHLRRIEEKIEGRNKEHDERYEKIEKLEKKVDYIMYIVGLLTVVTSIVAGWAIPRILDSIFN